MSDIKIKNVANNAVCSVISLLLSIFFQIPVIPILPFLKFDISDIPIFIATLKYGLNSGITVLFVVNIIRTLFFSSVSWIGFLMRITSIVIIFTLYLIKKSDKYYDNLFISLIILLVGTVLCVVIKMPLNYFFWVNIFFIPKYLIDDLMFKAIIPYNLLKVLINSIIALYLSKKQV